VLPEGEEGKAADQQMNSSVLWCPLLDGCRFSAMEYIKKISIIFVSSCSIRKTSPQTMQLTDDYYPTAKILLVTEDKANVRGIELGARSAHLVVKW
jgi:hypothetical protein